MAQPKYPSYGTEHTHLTKIMPEHGLAQAIELTAAMNSLDPQKATAQNIGNSVVMVTEPIQHSVNSLPDGLIDLTQV